MPTRRPTVVSRVKPAPCSTVRKTDARELVRGKPKTRPAMPGPNRRSTNVTRAMIRGVAMTLATRSCHATCQSRRGLMMKRVATRGHPAGFASRTRQALMHDVGVLVAVPAGHEAHDTEDHEAEAFDDEEE